MVVVNGNTTAPYLILEKGTGTQPADAVVEIEQLVAGWPGTWPEYMASQQDQGIMGPWSDNVAGTAPPCLVQQATADFNNWLLPVDPTAINELGGQITQEISNNGGTTGTAYGRTRQGGAEIIYWGVAFTTAPIVDATTPGGNDELGIIYVFTAQVGLTSDVELSAPQAGVGVVDGRTRIVHATTGAADVAQNAVRLPGLVLKLEVEVGVTAQG